MLRGTPGWRRIRPLAFEREDHLVDGTRGDAEVMAYVGFAGGGLRVRPALRRDRNATPGA